MNTPSSMRTGARGATRLLIAAALLLPCLCSAAASVTATITVTGTAQPGDSSSITVVFNGFTETVNYDSTSTVNSVASAFAAMFSRDDLQAGLCASATGNVITFKLKTGTFGAAAITGSTASFHLAASGFPTPTPPGMFMVSPTAVNFGPLTKLFTSAPQTVTLTNNSSSYVLLNNIAISGTNAGDFSLPTSADTCPNPIGPGINCTLQVTFTPSATGSRTASLVVTSDAASPSISVALSGQGVAPGAGPASLSPSSLNFALFSVPQNVTLTNSGNSALTINGISFGAGAYTQTNNCGTSLPAQSICTIAVTAFANGPNTGTMTVIDDATAGPQTASLTYTGVTGPTSYNFGGWSVGAQAISAPLAFEGNNAVNLDGTIGGTNASDFFVYRAPPTQPSLNQSGYCTGSGYPNYCVFTIAFIPTGTGVRTATLTMPGYGVLTLTGTGQPAGANFVIAASRTVEGIPLSSLSVFDTYLNTTVSNTAELLNTGTVPLTFNPPVVTGPNASQFSATESCGTLAQDTSCVLTVTAKPTQLGPISATVTVTDSTGVAQQSISVTSAGTAPAPTVSPASSFTFPATQIGGVSAPVGFTVTAYNNDPVTALLSNYTNNPFQFTQGSSCAQTPCTLYVTFAPTAGGNNSGFIRFTDSVFGGEAQVQLSGTGGLPVVSLSPTSLTFASRVVGSTSIAQTVTLSNTGTAVLNVSSISLAGADPADYVLTNNCGTTVAVSGTCTFTISFSPTASGTRTATVQIVSNASTSPDTVQLTGTATPAPLADTALTGVVYGGSSPVSGAHVYLFAASTGGYGAPSVSLLSAANTGYSDAVGAYVPTGSDGSFTLTGDYTCTNGQQLYLYALGGNSGYGTNAYAGMVAALGACPGVGGTPISATVNEVTTVAMAYALSGFMTDAVHLSSSSTPSALTGVANAFVTATNLASLATGTALSSTAGGGSAPQTRVNGLANILATCVQTNGGGSGCSTLFGLVTPSGSSAPADTVQAVLDIAHAPANNAGPLSNLILSTAIPFQPSITTAQMNWALSIAYVPPANTGLASSMAIDGAGNLWVAHSGYPTSNLQEWSNAGVLLSGSSGFTVPSPAGQISIDPAGNIWIAAASTSGVVKVSNSGTVLASYNYGLNASSIATDGAGNVWVGNTSQSGLFKFNNTGGFLSSYSGYSTGTITNLYWIAIDASEDAWAETSGTSVLEYSTSGTPLSTTSGYTGGGGPIAIDSLGNAWTNAGTALHELSPAGAVLSGPSGYPTCNPAQISSYSCLGIPFDSEPQSIAIDGLGNVWVPGHYYLYGNGYHTEEDSIVEISKTGAIVSGAFGYVDNFAGGNYPSLLQVDSSGNLWGVAPSTITEIVGAGGPVETPLSAAARDNKLATLP